MAMENFKWDIKVTSKGQITLPKQARDVMMVREGDHLEAVIQDDALVLTKKVTPDEAEQMRVMAQKLVRKLGFDTGGKLLPERRTLRESIHERFPDLTRLVREGREKQ
jgi:AbrB family looped-hinge helix DNA binding protein